MSAFIICKSISKEVLNLKRRRDVIEDCWNSGAAGNFEIVNAVSRGSGGIKVVAKFTVLGF